MPRATKICAECGKYFEMNASPANIASQRFCSKKCVGKVFSRIPPLRESIATRLAARQKPIANGCILYTGQNNGKYGQIEYRRHTYLVHRMAYWIHKGEIPEGVLVCHSCDTPLCINPEHLWLGTYADNVHDMDNKLRRKWNPRKKLTDEQVEEIRSRAGHGEMKMKLSIEFGVSPTLVSAICNGRKRTGPSSNGPVPKSTTIVQPV